MADEQNTTSHEPRVHTQQQGGHWVAWVGEAAGKTDAGWTVVGETKADAVARARARLERRAPVGDLQA